MDKHNIRILRECNQLPFAIIRWIVKPHEITIDPDKENIIEALVVLRDQFGFYRATIWTVGQQGERCKPHWRVKEIDAGKNPETGLCMTG